MSVIPHLRFKFFKFFTLQNGGLGNYLGWEVKFKDCKEFNFPNLELTSPHPSLWKLENLQNI